MARGMTELVEEREPLSWDEANEQAAHWHARLDAGLADEDAFEEWRAADPRHAAAFARIVAAEQSFKDIGPVDFADDPDFAPPKISRRRWLQMAAASATLVIGGGVWFKATAPAQAATAVGERRTIDISKGIKLDLNTDTRVRWKVSRDRVRIWLDQGELSLSLAGGATASQLIVPGHIATVVQGEINARLRDGALDLAVMAGECKIETDAAVSGQPVPVLISEGQSALVTEATPRVRTNTEAEREFITGWRQDVLVFDGQTLGVAVEEYNRYLTRKITIVDSDLAGLRIGGRFKTRDLQPFLDTLKVSFGIHVAVDARGAVLLSR